MGESNAMATSDSQLGLSSALCGQCSKQFPSEAKLKEHQSKSHAPERPKALSESPDVTVGQTDLLFAEKKGQLGTEPIKPVPNSSGSQILAQEHSCIKDPQQHRASSNIDIPSLPDLSHEATSSGSPSSSTNAYMPGSPDFVPRKPCMASGRSLEAVDEPAKEFVPRTWDNGSMDRSLVEAYISRMSLSGYQVDEETNSDGEYGW